MCLFGVRTSVWSFDRCSASTATTTAATVRSRSWRSSVRSWTRRARSWARCTRVWEWSWNNWNVLLSFPINSINGWITYGYDFYPNHFDGMWHFRYAIVNLQFKFHALDIYLKKFVKIREKPAHHFCDAMLASHCVSVNANEIYCL